MNSFNYVDWRAGQRRGNQIKKEKTIEKVIITFILIGLTGLVLFTSGCAVHQQTNELIAQANANRQEAYGNSMVACGDNAACQVGVSMMFASGAGQQQFFREDSPLDYVKVSGFILGPMVDLFRLYKTTTSGDHAGFVITGDNNQISGTANKLSANNQSTLTGTFDTNSSIEHLVYTQDSTQSSSNGNGSVENVENQQDRLPEETQTTAPETTEE